MLSKPKKNDIKSEYQDPKTGKFIKGNPGGGRPKGSGISITTEIKKKLEESPEGQKATYLQLLINRIFKQAIQDGDQQMIKNIWNYVDGLPIAKQEITGADGAAIDIDPPFNDEQIMKFAEKISRILKKQLA